MGEVKINLQRTVYFDYLRVLATIAVMVLHISALNWDNADINGINWQTFNLFNGIVRWCVPMFMMISGALFLGKEIPLSKMYSKYIIRMVAAFLSWSIFYAVITGGEREIVVKSIWAGHYHMWFVLMIIGIYICLPWLRAIAKDEKALRYYLGLSLVVCWILPTAIYLMEDFGSEEIVLLSKYLYYLERNMYLHIIVVYLAYFFLGYYISKIEIAKNQRIIIYCLGIFGFIFTSLISSYISIRNQTPNANYYSPEAINIFFQSLSIFIFFKYRNCKFTKLNSIVRILAKYSFGAYLVHAFVLEQINIIFDINKFIDHPSLYILIITGLVFVISYLISAAINLIPVLNKYIV